jgi:hypothetical protein
MNARRALGKPAATILVFAGLVLGALSAFAGVSSDH